VLFTSDAVVVVDAGAGGSGLLEFLSEQEIKRVHTVYISHADQDHIGGLVGLLAAGTVRIERVVLNADGTKETKLWADLVHELDDAGKREAIDLRVGLTVGEVLTIGDVRVDVVSPSKALVLLGAGNKTQGRRITSNSISAVLRLSKGKEAIAVLAADLDGAGLDDLIESGRPSTAPVLVFPHHGGGSGTKDMKSFVEKLFEVISPSLVVFSIGRDQYQTPRPELVRLIRQLYPKTRIVCTQLSTHCASAVPPAEAPHLAPYFARGRQKRACCGGTIVVDLAKPLETRPSADVHTEFVAKNAASPLCATPPKDALPTS
jgi:competence protein ComEC